MNIQTVTLVEVVAAARSRHASLVPESAGYLMLSLGRAMAGLPLSLALDEVQLGTDGAVTLSGARSKLEPDTAAEWMQALLKRLLEVSQGSPTALRNVATMELDAANALEQLFTSITKALIPLNRSAAKRALARLARETLRAKSKGISLADEAPLATPPSTPEQAAAPVPIEQPVEASPATEPVAPEPVAPELIAPEPVAPDDAAEDGHEDWNDIEVDIDLASPIPRGVTFELATPTPPPGVKAAAVASEQRAADHPEPTPTVVEATVAEPVGADDIEHAEPSGDALSEDAEARADLSDAIGEVVDQLSAVLGAMVEVHETPRTPRPVVAPVAAVQEQHEQEDHRQAEQACRDEEADVAEHEQVKQEVIVDEVETAPDHEEEQANLETEALEANVDALRADEDQADVDPLEAEAALAERLMTQASRRGRAQRRERSRDKRRGRIKSRVLAQKDQALLDRFGTDDESDAIGVAAASLCAMVDLDIAPPAKTPKPIVASQPVGAPPSASPAAVSEVSNDELDGEDMDELEPSTMTPPELRELRLDAAAFEPDHSHRPSRRGSRTSLLLSGLLLLGGIAAAGFVYGKGRGDASTTQTAAPAAPEAVCTANLDLRDLPKTHEVLVGLGRAPLMTRALPVGVRVELVAMAPGHQPKRLIIAADAEWRSEDGKRMLSLDAQLEAGAPTSWPEAPAGEVGGVGQPGFVGFQATPGDTELWLVMAAGDGGSARISVPCDDTAHILVVDTSDPSLQRRVSVEPELLRAAADKGSAELSLRL